MRIWKLIYIYIYIVVISELQPEIWLDFWKQFWYGLSYVLLGLDFYRKHQWFDRCGIICHIYKELIFNQSLLPEKVKKKIKQKRQLEKKI